MNTQKILYVITKSNWGGAQSYVHTLATEAVRQGASVVVALGGTGKKDAPVGELAKRLGDAGVRVLIVPSLMRDMSLRNDWQAYREIAHIIKKERPTIIHVNSSKAGGISALAGRLTRGVRIIFTVHGLPHQEPRAQVARALVWLASYATVLLATKTIALSKRQLLAVPAFFVRTRRLVCIPNGITVSEPLSRAQARAIGALREPTLAQYNRWIISTGELTGNKGIDVLINAFEQIYNTIPDVALVLFFNDGEDREKLLEQARRLGLSDRIFFLGFAKNVRELLRAADIFILPSRKEGVPFALLEAGIATCPIIATTVGGIPELINTNESGMLVPPNDVAALSATMYDLLNNPQHATKLGATFSKQVRKHFSSQEMIEQTFALYLEK